jgi:high-affinity iron transporter
MADKAEKGRSGTRKVLYFATLAGGLALAVDLLLRAVPSFRDGSVPEDAPAARWKDAEAAGRLLQALDYVAVDYREAVGGGKVLDPGEYEEQVEFLAKARDLLETFPPSPLKDGLARDLALAAAAVHKLSDPPLVEAHLNGMSESLRGSGLVPAEPPAPADPARGAALFAAECASCHGPQGRGDGPAGQALDPRPADFHDAERMDHATPLRFYHALRFGIEGTGMPSFAALAEEDLWALAHYIRTLASAPGPTYSGIE